MAADFNKPSNTDNYATGYTPAIVDNLQALAKDLDPPADLYSSSATKLHLARVITGRALAALAAPATAAK